MQKRLCGREQEFGARIFPEPDFSNLSEHDINIKVSDVAEKVLVKLSKIYKCVDMFERSHDDPPGNNYPTEDNFWFANGSRMYMDRMLLEIATPEHLPCTADSVLYEKATELMLNKAIAKFAREDHYHRTVSFYKNNISYGSSHDGIRESTYGSHHNYSCDRDSIGEITQLLISFMPAALLLTGNGHILFSGGKPKYCLSQRANHLSALTGFDTTSSRALINTRGFEDANTLMSKQVEMARMHLISCDATRCEFQTWLVEGVFHLVMRLAEEGWHLPKGFALARPMLSIQELNMSFGDSYGIRVRSGKSVSVRNYLRIFLEAAKQLKPLSEGEKKVVSDWEETLDSLGDLTGAKLIGKLDWATKFHLLKNQMRKNKFGLNSGQAMQINMEYHNISNDPNRSWFARLQERGHIQTIVSEKEILRATYSAPLTRAIVRGRFIRKCLKTRNWNEKLQGISWEDAIWKGKQVIFGKDGNPFSTRLDK